MSSKSVISNSVRSGSYRQNSIHEKLHSTSSTEEKIKFAGDESKDRLYEPKQNKKMVRVLTVIIYVFSVSLAAIMLSLYYGFFWKASPYTSINMPTKKPLQGDNVTNNKSTCSCLENHDGRSHNSVEPANFPFQLDNRFSELTSTEENYQDISSTDGVALASNDIETSSTSPDNSTDGYYYLRLEKNSQNSLFISKLIANLQRSNDT